jgi:hypothetical protein
MGTWDALFAAGMPGVVLASLAPIRGTASSAYIQWWRAHQIESEGGYQVSTVGCRATGTETAIGHLRRGDRVTVAGTEYQAVTDAESDGHGVCTLYLEPIA